MAHTLSNKEKPNAHEAGPTPLLSVGGAQVFSPSQSLSPFLGPFLSWGLQGGLESVVSTLSYCEEEGFLGLNATSSLSTQRIVAT